MNLKYKIALTMLATLNLRLYPMKKDINNNNNNNNNNIYDLIDFEGIFNQLSFIKNQKKIQDLLDKNIKLKKEFVKNKENINKNENQIQELIKDSKKNLLSSCLVKTLETTLLSIEYKKLIYPTIKTNFLNKLNKEQLCELLTILIKSNEKPFKALAKIILDQEDIELNNLNIQCSNYKLPIIIYAMMHNKKSIVKLLIKKGANVNIQDGFGITALIQASTNGDINIVKLLIEKGADLNKQSSFGKTPLMLALEKGHTEIAKLLIEKGADLNKQDRFGQTALEIAQRKNLTEIVNLIQSKLNNNNNSNN